MPLRQFEETELGVPEDRRQEVIEVVDDPADQLADAFDPLRFEKLILEIVALRDVSFRQHVAAMLDRRNGEHLWERFPVSTHSNRLARPPPGASGFRERRPRQFPGVLAGKQR